MPPAPPRSLAVEYQPLPEVRPAKRNAKGHDLATIRASFRRFGLANVAAVQDDRSSRIVAGHGRLEALAEMAAAGDPPPSGVHLGDDDVWLVPVLVGAKFRNATEAEAFLLVDNRSTELGGYSAPLLAEMLADHAGRLEGTGYTIDDLPAAGPGGNEDDPDALPVPEQPVSKLGDVWQLGRHRLVCGSSADPKAWTLLAPPPADLVFTDPPYGVSYSAKNEMLNRAGKGSGNRLTSEIAGDELDAPGLEALLRATLAPTLEASRPGAAWFVCAPHGPLFLPFAVVLTEWGIWHQTVLWVKDTMVIGRSDYHGKHEPIFAGAAPGAPAELYDPDDAETVLYGWAPGAAHTAPPNRRQTTVWEVPRPLASKVHPTMKPIALIDKAIRNHTRPGAVVLDPFGGSGSTLIAAELSQRTGYTIELHPPYVDVIARRWQQTTGDVPVLNGVAHTMVDA